MRFLASAALVFGWCAATAMPTAAAGPFYSGKRVSVLINFAPGGSTDIAGRLFAKHIGKHIDGQPALVVQNMDGAGGLNGALYLGEVAPKDGTVMGFLGGTTWQYASEPDRFRVDLKNYTFIAHLSNTTVYYARTDVPPRLAQPSDIVRAKGIVAGGNGPYNGRDLLIRLTLDMLGVPFRYLTGYRSGQAARLALQRNEINFFAEPALSYRSVVEPSLVKNGQALGVYLDPRYDGASLSTSNEVQGLPVPPFQELYLSANGAKPAGRLWQVYLAVLTLNSAFGTVIALPPGAPREAAEALRAAVMKLGRDRSFVEDAARIIGYVPQFETAADIDEKVRRALTVSPDVKAFVADYVKRANRPD
jgi:tripartite-type tricarboxylate transporter receptor subunit TctC